MHKLYLIDSRENASEVILKSHFDQRVNDLLEANNRYLERAREAERKLNEANLTIALLQGDGAVKVGA